MFRSNFQGTGLHNTDILFQFILFVSIGLISLIGSAEGSYIQSIHVLDPDIEEFKRYASWNSDQWLQILRQRYIQDFEERRNTDADSSPLYGKWVNIILIASLEEINHAFSQTSNRTYPDDSSRSNYYWSDISFPSYVVVRKVSKTSETAGESEGGNIQSQYNVFNCAGKKMFINAIVNEAFNPTSIQTLFPKKVKNPKDKLRIPLGVCNKVSQVRGLLDEIQFQLKGPSN